MRRAIIFAVSLLLSGCVEEENPPQPRMVCTMVTGTYSCGRGGTCEQCGNWQIGCPKPLELKAKLENGALICRLKENADVSTSTPMAPPLR
jgi:hypothetical protein